MLQHKLYSSLFVLGSLSRLFCSWLLCSLMCLNGGERCHLHLYKAFSNQIIRMLSFGSYNAHGVWILVKLINQ